MAVYLDASAVVKLVLAERETDALRRYLAGRADRVSNAVARVEVTRAVRPHGFAAVGLAREILARLRVIAVDDAILDAAAQLDAPLRTLDAIHLVSALALGGALEAFATYDADLFEVASAQGLPAVAPGRG